jgi:hypothetical protein
MTTVTPAIGDVAVVPVPGGYGACQISGGGDNEVTAYALAWHSADEPGLSQLAGAAPLILDHHANRGHPAQITISGNEPPPPGWVWLGHLPVPAGVPAASNSYSGWSWLPAQITAQRRWDRRLPAAVKQAYQAGATRGHVEVDFGDGPQVLGAATSRLDLTGAAGPVRWPALDQLPRCTSLTWTGPDRGLAAALAERPIIHDLTWTDAPSRLDLRNTGLTSLSIGGTVDQLHLPADLTSLSLLDGARVGAVTAAEAGRWLRVSVTNARIPAGLAGVRDLRQLGEGTISAAPLAALRDLESLWLSWHGAPGTLVDAAVLGELPRLSRLTLTDAYGLGGDTLPDLPALTGLAVHGLSRTAATALRARYRRAPIHLTLTGAKNDTWLAANLTNPLRDWADDDPRGGAAACKAYATAVRAIDARPTQAPETLRTFVKQLNRIDAKYDLIDTVRREEAAEAFADLATRAGVPTDLADTWFDDWRDF